MRRAIRVAAFAALAWSCRPGAVLAGGSLAEVDANVRAAGNRKSVAIAIGRRLFAKVPPVQILKVRVDGVGSHEVAGLLLSGLHFHGPVDASAFQSEVVGLVSGTFAASSVEEVDVWATIPLRVGEQSVVAGDKAVPTSRVVYAVTVRRADAPAFAAAAEGGKSAFWDPVWKAGLQAP